MFLFFRDAMKFPFRECFKNFVPYSSGKSEFTGEASIFLDTNENPYGDTINRYPSPLHTSLREEIAMVKNIQFHADISTENILLGNGSDEMIALLVQLFCDPKDAIAITPPTYGMYAVVANSFQVRVEEHWQTEENGEFLFPASLFRSVPSHTKLIFLCHPNNPTGQALSLEDIGNVLSANPNAMVVVDEAYIDFCETQSVLSWLKIYPNLIVLHTFSKMWGLAGARCGMAIAHPEVIQKLSALKMPYNVNTLTAQAVHQKLIQKEEVFIQQEEILVQKRILSDFLAQQPWVQTVFPSHANFILFRCINAQSIFETLVSEGIIIRNFSKRPGTEDCLRITIGTPEQNARVMEVLLGISKTWNAFVG